MKIKSNKREGKPDISQAIAAVALGALMSFQADVAGGFAAGRLAVTDLQGEF